MTPNDTAGRVTTMGTGVDERLRFHMELHHSWQEVVK